MEIKLKLKIENLYGGDGVLRYIDVREVKFTRTKSKKTTKSTTGISTDSGVDEEQSEIVKKEIQTFKRDKDDKPIIRLGGVHGKLWGHFKAAGKMLADLGEDGFDSKAFVDRMMMTINLSPVNVSIKEYEKIEIAEIPQITAGISKALIIQKFDYIPECKVDMILTFPEIYKNRVLNILKQSEQLAGLNKRRATITILNKKEIFGKE